MNDSYTKKDSNQLKGIAIGLVLAHHLFLKRSVLTEFGTTSLLFDIDTLHKLANYSKVSVALFVFVTAYAYMVNTKGRQMSLKETEATSLKRWISFMIPFWLVFVIMQLICNISGVRSYCDVYGNVALKSSVNFIIDGLGLANCFDTPTLNPTWWYMSLAILLAFAMPVIGKASERFGIPLLIAAVMIIKFYKIGNYWTYIAVAILAVVLQTHDFFGFMKKLSEKKTVYSLLVLVAVIVFILGAYYTHNSFRKWNVITFVISVPAFTVLQCLYVSRIKPLAIILEFLGKHSMNIFLIHTFLFKYFFREFIYQFKYTLLIWLALICASLICSILIKLVYNLLKLDALKTKCIKKIDMIYGISA